MGAASSRARRRCSPRSRTGADTTASSRSTSGSTDSFRRRPNGPRRRLAQGAGMTATSIPITPPDVITQEFRTPRAVRRGVVAGVVGNMLEWYDFALFGFFAQQIGAHFFPAGNPTASLLAAFGTFAAGFVMRPVGGALFGWVGDRFGRKQALIWSVLAMAFPSFFIGVLPGAETIGLAAPVLLLLFRLLQGLAVGGEYMASAVFLVEGAEPGRRGWMGSWGPLRNPARLRSRSDRERRHVA